MEEFPSLQLFEKNCEMLLLLLLLWLCCCAGPWLSFAKIALSKDLNNFGGNVLYVGRITPTLQFKPLRTRFSAKMKSCGESYLRDRKL